MSKDIFYSEGGNKTELVWEGDSVVLKNTQDMGVIDANLQRLREAAENRNRIAGMRWVGSIPTTIYADWQREYRGKSQDVSWNQFLAMKINSSDFTKLRTERV